MTSKSSTATAIDPEAIYEVKLARIVVFGRARLSPRHNPHRMKGKVVLQHTDSIASVKLIEPAPDKVDAGGATAEPAEPAGGK